MKAIYFCGPINFRKNGPIPPVVEALLSQIELSNMDLAMELTLPDPGYHMNDPSDMIGQRYYNERTSGYDQDVFIFNLSFSTKKKDIPMIINEMAQLKITQPGAHAKACGIIPLPIFKRIPQNIVTLEGKKTRIFALLKKDHFDEFAEVIRKIYPYMTDEEVAKYGCSDDECNKDFVDVEELEFPLLNYNYKNIIKLYSRETQIHTTKESYKYTISMFVRDIPVNMSLLVTIINTMLKELS